MLSVTCLSKFEFLKINSLKRVGEKMSKGIAGAIQNHENRVVYQARGGGKVLGIRQEYGGRGSQRLNVLIRKMGYQSSASCGRTKMEKLKREIGYSITRRMAESVNDSSEVKDIEPKRGG